MQRQDPYDKLNDKLSLPERRETPLPERGLDLPFARVEPYAFALLRIVAGTMFFFHGAQKIFGWVTTKPGPDFATQLWFGGVLEIVGGALIALGLLTRPAALLTSGMMAVAYFQFHWKLQFDDWQWLPIVNKGEMAVLYAFVFLVIALRGGGRWSLDGLLRRR